MTFSTTKDDKKERQRISPGDFSSKSHWFIVIIFIGTVRSCCRHLVLLRPLKACCFSLSFSVVYTRSPFYQSRRTISIDELQRCQQAAGILSSAATIQIKNLLITRVSLLWRKNRKQWGHWVMCVWCMRFHWIDNIIYFDPLDDVPFMFRSAVHFIFTPRVKMADDLEHSCRTHTRWRYHLFRSWSRLASVVLDSPSGRRRDKRLLNAVGHDCGLVVNVKITQM